MVTLYNVVSADGFIAGEDGNEDFIPDELWQKTLEVFKKFDALVMGRKTYQAMQSYDQKLLAPFEALSIKKYVVTHDTDYLPKAGYEVLHFLPQIAELKGKVLVSSGPELNNELISAGMVGERIVEIVPVTLREGIKPY